MAELGCWGLPAAGGAVTFLHTYSPGKQSMAWTG